MAARAEIFFTTYVVCALRLRLGRQVDNTHPVLKLLAPQRTLARVAYLYLAAHMLPYVGKG